MYPKNRPLPPEAAGRAVKPSNRKEIDLENSDMTTLNAISTTQDLSLSGAAAAAAAAAAVSGTNLKKKNSDSLELEQTTSQQKKSSHSCSRTALKVRLSPLYSNNADGLPEYESINSDCTHNINRSPAISTLPNETGNYKKGTHKHAPSYVSPPPYEESLSQLSGVAGEQRIFDPIAGYGGTCMRTQSVPQPSFGTSVISEDEILFDGFQSNSTVGHPMTHYRTVSFPYPQQHHYNCHQCQLLNPHHSCFPYGGSWPLADKAAFYSQLPRQFNKATPPYVQHGCDKKHKNDSSCPTYAGENAKLTANEGEKEASLISEEGEEEEEEEREEEENGEKNEGKEENEEATVDKKKKNNNKKKVSADGRKSKKLPRVSQAGTKGKTSPTTTTDGKILIFKENQEKEKEENYEQSQQSSLPSWEENAKYVLEQHQHDVSLLMRVIVGLLERISSIKKTTTTTTTATSTAAAAAAHKTENVNGGKMEKTVASFVTINSDSKATINTLPRKEEKTKASAVYYKDQLNELQDVLMKIQKEGISTKKNYTSPVESILALPQLLPLSAVSCAAFEKLATSLSKCSLLPKKELILCRGMYAEVKALMKTLDFETTRPIFLDLAATKSSLTTKCSAITTTDNQTKKNETNNTKNTDTINNKNDNNNDGDGDEKKNTTSSSGSGNTKENCMNEMSSLSV